MMKILITGVHGFVGNLAFAHFSEGGEGHEVVGVDRSLVMSDRVAEGGGVLVPPSQFVCSDLSEMEELVGLMGDVDVVVHLAADPRGEAPWESVLANNIEVTYRIFEAARLAGVARVVLASSVHVSNGYRVDDPYREIVAGEFSGEPGDIPKVTVEDPIRPVNYYGVSKVCGEALARMYSEAHGLSVLCLRLGWVCAEDRPPSLGDAPAFCSQRDAVQLIAKCVSAPSDLRFGIYYGFSANRNLWVDLENAKIDLGYEPQDCGDDLLA